MSATPIPRTLMMTAYGDLDVSRLTEKPAGRLPVDTRAVPLDRIDEVVPASAGRSRTAKAYWICPMVEEWRMPTWPPPRSATMPWRHWPRAASASCTGA